MAEITKPSILPGMMELLPADQIKFNEMKDIIRKNYEKFGFVPLDTPVMEKTEVLLAKGGGETEKQIYKIDKSSTDISMRFDLTVPLARFTAQNYSELNFPFRRYHIAKVYRGERNQRGRFREFYQCDVDIIGDETLDIINDAEIPNIIYNTFSELNIGKFTIRINNRKILKGFYNSKGLEDTQSVLRIVDKLEKIGKEGVKSELLEIGASEKAIEDIMNFISISGSNLEKVSALESLGIEDEIFKEGVDEIRTVLEYLEIFGVPEEYIEFDLSIARGLDYYTGTVYETRLDDHPEIGSICSGGRYEDLASYYINKKLPGVGISIGLTRLFWQLQEAGLIDKEDATVTEVLVVPFEGYEKDAAKLNKELRDNNINSFINSEKGKLGKKMKYANNLNIPYVILVGEEEVKTGRYAFKNMETGDQENLSVEEIVEKF